MLDKTPAGAPVTDAKIEEGAAVAEFRALEAEPKIPPAGAELAADMDIDIEPDWTAPVS